MSGFTIGRLAAAAGVTVETVRYYERRGLLEQPERSVGYREYSQDDVDRLAFVRRAKALGFTLAEIRALLAAAGTGSIADVLAAARAKMAAVDGEIRTLQATRSRLSHLVRVCEAGDADCVALEVPAC